MRKLLLAAGLLASGFLLAGSPASAEVGCSCVKLGAAPVCVASVAQCNRVIGGLCLAPCSYVPPRSAHRAVHRARRAHRRVVRRHAKPAMGKPAPKAKPKSMSKPAKKDSM